MDHLEDAVHAWMVVKRDSTSATNDKNANGDVAILVDPNVCHRSGSGVKKNQLVVVCTSLHGLRGWGQGFCDNGI